MSELAPQVVLHVGKTADWVAIAGTSVWVGSTGPNAVTRIDSAKNAIADVVPLRGEPCAGLAAGAGYLWVPLCGKAPGLARVDLKTHRLADVFPIGPAGPEGGVAVSADSVWLVTDKLGSLARIDPATGRVRQVVKLPPGSYNPAYAAGRVYVTRAEGAAVTVVDARSGRIVKTIATGPGPRFLSAAADAVWTLNQGDGSLTRIDTATLTAGPAVPLATPGQGGDIAYRGGRVWTTMSHVPLTLTDARHRRVRRQWVGAGGDSLAVSADAVWLTDYRGGAISRFPLKDLLAALR